MIVTPLNRPRTAAAGRDALVLLLLLPLLVLLTAAAPITGLNPQVGRESLPAPLPAAEFTRRIVEGSVDAHGLVIEGDIDLRPIGRVERLLRCTDCTVLGSVNAADVVFARVVDLSGLQVRGGLDLHGARMEDAFLLQASRRRQARIEQSTDLDLITFASTAGFDGARFGGPVRAQNVHVRGTASFADTQFAAAAQFDYAAFDNAVSFAGGVFKGEARFTRARFGGTASFQQSQFEQQATFTGATFEDRANFMLAQLQGAGRFDSMTLEDGANFRVVQALAPLSTQQTRAEGPIDFQGSAFSDFVSLSGIATSDVLSLLDVTIAEERGLRMEPMLAAGLLIDIPTVEQIPGSGVRARALEMLEETAKARGELALANDARYTLLSLQSQDRQGLQWLLDTVFYRGVSGYLVRPSHPLLVLVLVLLLAGSIRAVPRWRAARQRVASTAEKASSGWRGGWARVERSLGPVVEGVHESMRHTVGRSTARAEETSEDVSPFRASGRAIESLLYKLLLVVLVITLGRSWTAEST